MEHTPRIQTKRILGHKLVMVTTKEPGVKSETLSHEGMALGQVRSHRGSKIVTYELSDGTVSGELHVGRGGKTKEKLFTELRRKVVELTLGAKS